MKPFIRWAGSKRKIVNDLERFWTASGAQRYIEPFCGSGCLFFHIEPNEAILGDTNEWLLNTLKCVAENPDRVYDKLCALPRNKNIYLKIRSIHFSKFGQYNAAAYFLYLNRLCFNGLFRTNMKGLFNVPYADTRTGSHPSRNTLREASLVLQKATLEKTDFFKTISKHITKDDFVYLDPPYATENGRVFRQYSPSTFGIKDIERLSGILSGIDDHGAKFALSYADTSEIQPLTERWNCHRHEVVRNISGFAKGRKKASEIVLTNF